MYARLSRYRFRVEHQQRWVDNLRHLDAIRRSEVQEEPAGLALVAGLDGCRGAWFMVPEDDPDYEELIRAEEQRITEGVPSSYEQREVVFSLWDTHEQAMSVRERLGEQLAGLFQDVGLTFAGPPETEVFRVDGGRPS
ncbi:hypothetical protein LY71_10363 [Geodermatophilus tzadiensis]|uniref:Uncharacterized protein n=1 Tax=Geodermatophilus tzadiensis TaxID=1137988 RepID=A0A2T0TXT9_9ACTN|nr:hypothetical protein [Geodermatophilus tzadiensis]PRY50505.1 hypothetical protein LY71_10363 [Geodermatophilus tzadiensis]